jgi:hypothetical protein
MKMVRKQVYITPEQDARLKTLSTVSGASEAELIRRGIDLIGRAGVSEAERQRAGDEFIEELKRRARMLPHGGSTKTWRREDSYDDERHARLLR